MQMEDLLILYLKDECNFVLDRFWVLDNSINHLVLN